MLKILPTDASKLLDFKCGEIYCITSSSYNVACCLCTHKVPFEEFTKHFQKHWEQTQANSTVTTRRRSLRKAEQAKPKVEITLNENPIKSEENSEEESSYEPTLFTIYKEEAVDGEEKDEPLVDLADLQMVSMEQPMQEEPLCAAIVCEEKKEKEMQKTEPPLDDDKDNDSDWQGDEAENENDSDYEETKEENATKEILPFPCSKCERSYKSKRSLQHHLRSNHSTTVRKPRKPKQEHKCDECGVVFGSERLLRGHKWKHTGIFCDICGKPFSQAGNMIRHKIRHTGIKAHKCAECGNDFYTEKELRAHMLRHTGIMPIICEICGRPCRDRGVLTAHMRRHTGERPAKCPVCGKCFYSFHDLNVHAVAHTSERPFVCDVCGSTFQRKKALRVHKKLHSTERKHVCKICGKSFAQSSGLNTHMRTHDAAASKSIGVVAAGAITTTSATATAAVESSVVAVMDAKNTVPEVEVMHDNAFLTI